jgi:hypothetical protein
LFAKIQFLEEYSEIASGRLSLEDDKESHTSSADAAAFGASYGY